MYNLNAGDCTVTIDCKLEHSNAVWQSYCVGYMWIENHKQEVCNTNPVVPGAQETGAVHDTGQLPL